MPLDTPTEFSQWLRTRRRSLDLTRERLAVCVGCSPATIEKIENGERKPSRQIAELLARCLKVPEDLSSDFVAFARGSAPPPLPTDYSPVQAMTRSGVYLPAVPTEFIGRVQQVNEIRSLLIDGGVRLVSILGSPGIGKTRLSLEAASGLQGQFEDGIYFVPLSSLTNASLVLPAVASVLGVRQASHQSLIDTLIGGIRDKQLLLVLDNFEQILPASADVAALLMGVPGLKVLVSSRTALRIYGEHTFVVPPMSLPATNDPGSVWDPAALHDYEAISLFIRRARAANSSFVLNESNAAQVIAICRRLDGLPLAIELAANRARVLSAGQILERLSGSLDLLARGANDLPERQRSLRGAIAWGYDVLSTEQQSLFRLMAVYAGGCTFEALQGGSTDGAANEMQLVDNLSALVDSSLVQQRDSATGARFSMLDTIAEYAKEKLAQAGEVGQAKRHHAAYFLGLAEEAEPHLQGGDQTAWLDRLDLEHDNIRAAYDYFREESDGVALARLVSSLRRFWYLRGNISEGEDWLQAALAYADMLPAEVLARTLHGMGTLLWSMGEMARAEGYFAKSLVIRRELGDKRGIADMLNNLGIVLLPQGKYSEARVQHTESLDIYRELGDGWSISLSLANLGLVALDSGEYDEAETLLRESLALRREVGDEQGAAQSLNNLGIVRRCVGDIDGACALHEESLGVFRKLGDKWSTAFAMGNMAYALLRGGRGDAARYFLDSLALFKELGVRTGIVSSFEGLAQLASAESKSELAVTLFGFAERLRGEIELDMLPYNQALYAERLENTLQELSQAKVPEAWSKGQRLDIEGAYRLVIGEWNQ